MGQMLDKPILEKESASSAPSGALRLSWASTCMQGWRLGMEDAHICLPSLPIGELEGDPVAESWRGVALFGVLDGHGGEQVAKFCERHLPEELCRFPLNGRTKSDLEAALTHSFHRMDELLEDRRSSVPELRRLANKPVPQAPNRPAQHSAAPNPDNIGCTACVCAITDRQIAVANAGDSRAVLCRGGRAVPLSFDHKPNHPRERQRIEAAGGTVEHSGPGQWRVNGNLNLSRALGDLVYKKDVRRKPEEQIICSTPDVIFEDRSEDDEFIIICCDGVWDVMQNQQVVDFVRGRLPEPGEPTQTREMVRAIEALLDKCVSPNLRQTEGLGGDNMTAVLIHFGADQIQACSAHVPPPPSASPAEERELLPSVASVQRRASHPDGRAGLLRVALDVPASCAMAQLFLHFSAAAAAVRVGVLGAQCSRLLELQRYLPKGAALEPADAEEQLAVAKFYPKVRQLELRLPWTLVR